MKLFKSITLFTLFFSFCTSIVLGQETYFPGMQKMNRLIDTKHLKSNETILVEEIGLCRRTNIKLLKSNGLEEQILYTGTLRYHAFNELPNNNWVFTLITDFTDDVGLPLEFQTITFIDGEIDIFSISDDQITIPLSSISNSAVINNDELVLTGGTFVYFTDFTLSNVDSKSLDQALTLLKSPFPDDGFLYYRYGNENEILSTNDRFETDTPIVLNLGEQFRDVHYFGDWAVFHDQFEVSAVFGIFFFQLEKDKEILGWRQHGQNLTYHTISNEDILTFKKIYLNDGNGLEVDSLILDLNDTPLIQDLHWDGDFIGYNFNSVPLPWDEYEDDFPGENYNLNYNTDNKVLSTKNLDISIDEIEYNATFDTMYITDEVILLSGNVDMEITLSNLSNEMVNDVHLHSAAFEGINCFHNALKVDDDVIQIDAGASKTISARYEGLLFDNINFFNFPLCVYAIGANNKYDENFEDNIYCLELSEFTSVEDSDEENATTLYPNPTSNFLILKNGKEQTTYDVLNFDGSYIRSEILEVNKIIDVSDLRPGMYLLMERITGNQHRFVKQ